MNATARFLLLTPLLFAGCHTVEKVGVTTFHVIDAPANYVRHKIDDNETVTTITTTSDVSTPGHPVTSAPPKVTSTESRGTSSASSSTRKTTTTHAPAKPEFPTARPVPGKPGYVYSTDPKGGIIDVSGYKPGDKAKDPYNQQIFIVP